MTTDMCTLLIISRWDIKITGNLYEDRYVYIIDHISLGYKNNGYFIWRPICVHYWSYLVRIFLEWQTFQTKAVEKIKTHILCLTTFFLNRGFYEIMWKNFVESARPLMPIWRMRTACWTPNATNTHSELCHTRSFSAATTAARARPVVALYVHRLSCSFLLTSVLLPTHSLSDMTTLTLVGLSLLCLLLPVSVSAFHALIPFLSKGYT